jgi:hypothetical protein
MQNRTIGNMDNYTISENMFLQGGFQPIGMPNLQDFEEKLF